MFHSSGPTGAVGGARPPVVQVPSVRRICGIAEPLHARVKVQIVAQPGCSWMACDGAVRGHSYCEQLSQGLQLGR
jgi:hypothetical protein